MIILSLFFSRTYYMTLYSVQHGVIVMHFSRLLTTKANSINQRLPFASITCGYLCSQLELKFGIRFFYYPTTANNVTKVEVHLNSIMYNNNIYIVLQ